MAFSEPCLQSDVLNDKSDREESSRKLSSQLHLATVVSKRCPNAPWYYTLYYLLRPGIHRVCRIATGELPNVVECSRHPRRLVTPRSVFVVTEATAFVFEADKHTVMISQLIGLFHGHVS